MIPVADATFKWWLWLANLGPRTRDVIGSGVVALDLIENNATEKHLLCRRTDGSTSKFGIALCIRADRSTIKINKMKPITLVL